MPAGAQHLAGEERGRLANTWPRPGACWS
jgi:hypothetical protein